MPTIHIVVGSVMGSATAVAEFCAKHLAQHPLNEVRVNSAFQKSQLNPDEILLVCTSNTGVGDLPHNIAPLLQHLTCDYPAIAGMRFGLINLGDSSYPSFGHAGQKIEAALVDIGAVRIGEALVIDQQLGGNPIELTEQWLKSWSPLL